MNLLLRTVRRQAGWLLALPLLLAALGVAAQGQQARYRAGQLLLDQGNYAQAMKQLEPLAQPINHFAHAPDAGYLYAVAAGRAGQWPEAEQMLNLIRNRYPGYAALNEVLYLQGEASFEQGDYDTALRTLGLLPAEQYGPLRENMQAFYLARLQDAATWQRLLRRYPQSKLLGRLYADFLLAHAATLSEVDRQQLDALVTKYALDRAHYAAVLQPAMAPHTAARKASYNVGVLLPFELQDPSWQTQRRNQFITDLYAGLRLAQDSLTRAGHPVQLFAYDTGADTVQLKTVLALPELAGMDMLIGPIYKSGARLLARYAREHQVVCVNPMSQDGDLVADNPWHYLYSPSAATQGRAAAAFAASTFGTGRPAVVVYDNDKDGRDFAAAYQQALEAAGGHVAASHACDPDDAASLAAAFQSSELAGAGHLVVASDSRKAARAAYAAQSSVPAATRPALLAPGTWLESEARGGAYYYHPKAYSEQSAGFRRFRQLYLQRQKLPPSVFACQGFELGLFFGNVLFQFGPAFQAALADDGTQPGAIFEGFNYPSPARDNQVVPIVRPGGYEFQRVR